MITQVYSSKSKKAKKPHTIRELKIFSKQNKQRDVPLEKSFRLFLKGNRIPYQRQKPIGYYIVDFIFKKRRLIVEMYEQFHQQQESYDLKRQAYLEKLGFNFLIIKEGDDFQEALNKILAYPEDKINWKFCVQTIQWTNSRGYSHPKWKKQGHINFKSLGNVTTAS